MIVPLTPNETFTSRLTGVKAFCAVKLIYGSPRLGLGTLSFHFNQDTRTISLQDTLAHAKHYILIRDRANVLNDYLRTTPIIYYGASGLIHEYTVPISLDISPVFLNDVIYVKPNLLNPELTIPHP